MPFFLFFFKSRYLSHFWIFGSQIFTKCLISCHILIIWWKIWVLLTIIFSLKIWLSPSSLTVDVTSMAVKDQLDITQSFLHFFISNFHETSLFMIYFDNLMKNLVFECDMISAVFFDVVDISSVFDFFYLKFSWNV